MRTYLYIWFFLTLIISFEYWALNQNQNLSLLMFLQKVAILKPGLKLNTQPGRLISLWLGWMGFSLMVLMNVYSLRKRFHFMKNLGRLSKWLNFHIFCGILGPTLILFHCGLKVRGLVGISFWSMVVSFSSGIIGRYFFVQLSYHRSDFEKEAQRALESLNKILEKYKIITEPAKKERILSINLVRVGGHVSQTKESLLLSFFSSLSGDLRILFTTAPMPKSWPPKARAYVMQYALSTRKAHSLHSFEKLMGYWHAFHFPFAVFMYIAAIIHIFSSLIFLGNS